MPAFRILDSQSILLTVVMVLASIGGACAAPPMLGAIDRLEERKLYIHQWSMDSNDTIALSFTAMGEYGLRYIAYAQMDRNGNIIVGPDSIPGMLFVGQILEFFGADGKWFVYDKPEEWASSVTFIYYEYDPLTRKFSSHNFMDPPLDMIKAASNIPSLGNVIYGATRQSHDHPYMIAIHDVNADTFSTTHIDLGHFSSDADGIQISRLPRDMLLLAGTAPSLTGQYYLYNMIYDLASRKIMASEALPLDSLSQSGFPKFSSPGPAQTFKYGDAVYYLALGQKTWDSLDSIRYDTYLIRYDQQGKVVATGDAAPLQIKAAQLTATPRQFIFLRDHAGKFWMMSLDALPLLQLDRNER